MKKIVKLFTSIILSCLLSLSISSTLPAHAAYVNQLGNYPTYNQIGGTCWAYSILSMANYVYGNNFTINDIYDAYTNVTGSTNYNGATVNQARNVMAEIFTDYNPVKKGVLSSNGIKAEINSDFPVYIRGDGHAVSLMGYRAVTASSSVNVIYYMNSATGLIMFTGYAEGTTNTFYTNSSQVYEWQNSIIIAG